MGSETTTQMPGLDFDFLRYIGVVPENQRRIQAFYLPVFDGCQKVLDLGCGDGDFVSLLQERGVDVVGVDADDKAYAAAAARDLPVVQADIFAYLEAQEAESIDGIFSAHLVEHLPYTRVVKLIELAFRVLRPGGVVVLATPDTRSIFSHLEMFYLHFGHISFYHPRLLCFFLEHAGFAATEYGTNPETASPLLADARAARDTRPDLVAGPDMPAPPIPSLVVDLPALAELTELGGFAKLADLAPPVGRDHPDEPDLPAAQSVAYLESVPLRGPSVIHRLSCLVRRWLTRFLLKSELDALATNVNGALAAQEARYAAGLQHLAACQQQLSVGQQQLSVGQQQLSVGQQQLSVGQQQLVAGVQILRANQGLLQAGQENLGAQAADALAHVAEATLAETDRRRQQVAQLEAETRAVRGDLRAVIDALQTINGPFECYARAIKPAALAEVPAEAPSEPEPVSGGDGPIDAESREPAGWAAGPANAENTLDP